MASHNDTGKKGESIAFTHLQTEGYTLLGKNWKNKHDELDIIAKKEGVLVFVEVKTRTNSYAGDPAASVTIAKQKRIIRTAKAFLDYYEDYDDIRFDIISIISNQKGDVLEHIEDAFYPTL